MIFIAEYTIIGLTQGSANPTIENNDSHTKPTGMYIQVDSDSERDSDVDIDNPPPGTSLKIPGAFCEEIEQGKGLATAAGDGFNSYQDLAAI